MSNYIRIFKNFDENLEKIDIILQNAGVEVIRKTDVTKITLEFSSEMDMDKFDCGAMGYDLAV